jgi:hypothetical protein
MHVNMSLTALQHMTTMIVVTYVYGMPQQVEYNEEPGLQYT